MQLADFDYQLPAEQIAQAPLPERDASRLLLLDRASGTLEHRDFLDLPGLLRPGDILVLNDSRVIPARLRGFKTTGGRAEVLLVRPTLNDRWLALTRPGLRAGQTVVIERDGIGLSAEALAVRDGGLRELRLTASGAALSEALSVLGELPTPPYIHRRLRDPQRYQTVYAAPEGSVAPPTAGLHFTERLFAALAERGVGVERLTLHVGPGTFQPVRSERVEEHRMHAEWFVLTPNVAARLNAARREGRRCIAVGTTTTRVLESAAAPDGTLQPGSGDTALFITPGHHFRAVDGLVTNFHLPRSTLLMLVCAFAGRERVLAAYAEAVRAGYRFYSFGDAMLLV